MRAGCAGPRPPPRAPHPRASRPHALLGLRACLHLQVVDEEATAKAQEEADKKATEEGKEAEKVAPGGRTGRAGRRRRR